MIGTKRQPPRGRPLLRRSPTNSPARWMPQPRRNELLAALALTIVFFVVSGWMYPSKRPEETSVSVSHTQRLVLQQGGGDSDGGRGNEYPVQDDDESASVELAREVLLDPDQEEAMRERVDEMIEQSLDESSSQTTTSRSKSSKPIPQLGGLLFTDADEYLSAPNITIPNTPLRNYRGLWYLQKLHDNFFEQFSHKRWIPHLDQPISRKQFHQIFRQTSTPVVMKFEHMRHLGVMTKAWTLEELREKFPYEPTPGSKVLAYTANAGLANNQQLDFGPALYELQKDAKLKRGAKGSTLRNFPRNLMIKPKYLSLLDATFPPFLPRNRFQVPTLWMGTTTADTKLHHDCCDNFVTMLAGVKRWFIAPPPDTRNLKPVVCSGKHQSLCWANGLKYPNKKNLTPKEKAQKDSLQSIILDLQPGEMLYLPAGWWHHIENLTPNVMVNQWTRGCSNSAVALDADPNRSDRPDFHSCPRVAQKNSEWMDNN